MEWSGGLLWYCVYMGLAALAAFLWLIAAFLPAPAAPASRPPRRRKA